MRDYITSVLLVIMLLFSTLVTAADVKLNDQNSIEVFRLELTNVLSMACHTIRIKHLNQI